MLFPFCCLRLEKFKVQKCLSRRIRAILRQERAVLAVEISVSAAEMVLTLELNLERDKTGDVGKFHDTYIIHISKFMITRDHTLLIHQSIFATKTIWPFVVWHFAFQFVYYGKQWLDTFDDGYVDGIYLLRPVAKKCRLLWTYTRFVFNRVETKGGSVLYFRQDKHKVAYIFKRIKGGRDENVSTLPYNEL